MTTNKIKEFICVVVGLILALMYVVYKVVYNMNIIDLLYPLVIIILLSRYFYIRKVMQGE